jgi:hypothetical protein
LGVNPFPIADPSSFVSAALPEHFGARRRLFTSQNGKHIEAVKGDASWGLSTRS